MAEIIWKKRSWIIRDFLSFFFLFFSSFSAFSPQSLSTLLTPFPCLYPFLYLLYWNNKIFLMKYRIRLFQSQWFSNYKMLLESSRYFYWRIDVSLLHRLCNEEYKFQAFARTVHRNIFSRNILRKFSTGDFIFVEYPSNKHLSILTWNFQDKLLD